MGSRTDGLLAGNAASPLRAADVDRIFEELRGRAMTAVTTPCAVTPDGERRSAENPRLRPSPLALAGRSYSSTEHEVVLLNGVT